MESLKKIPVIGYIFRMLYAILKLPKHLDVIYQKNEYFEEQNKLLKKEQERLEQEKKQLKQGQEQLKQGQEQLKQGQEQLKQGQEQLKQGQEQLKQGQEQLRQGIEQLSQEEEKAQSELQQWKNMQQAAVDELRQWNYDRMDDIRRVQDVVFDLQELRVGEDYIKKMNLLTSIHPTIWGNENKLHISSLAAVSNCMFNTNSGHITVGDYTFAGSGVSILAGSHDMKLTGLLRRDVEMTEGCDITIGKGVWLASNCTVLGPATIGDNAVVAAGAVVVPGTAIPSGTIYGGVPAKCIGEIALANLDDASDPVIMQALERSGGVLYTKGWTEKREVFHDEKKYIGHYMADDMAKIYLTCDRYVAFYQYLKTDTCNLKVKVNDQEEIVYQLSEPEGMLEINIADKQQNQDDSINTICITLETSEAKLFLSHTES